jgi:hypothetical protein
MPEPEHPEHHFLFDQPKWTYYATTTYAWLRMPRTTEKYARESIEAFSHAGRPNWWPGRVAGSGLDLALALVQQNRVDEAAAAGNQALQEYGIRSWILRRARDLNQALAPYSDVSEVREFRDRYRLARRSSRQAMDW